MNTLYPIFLKADQLEWLVVGGGAVALEKLTFLYKSSPGARVTLVAPEIRPEIVALRQEYPLQLVTAPYHPAWLDGRHLVIAATNDPAVNREVYNHCRRRQLLVNVADTPDCCDFYLGGIVTRGDLKIAISTNGKAPTLAKRLRELFETVFPEDLQELLDNMQRYRKNLRGHFEEKVKLMNDLTKSLVNEDDKN
jgi:precorrin-2 dehydrogenase/sirohydrochlorin ferrochelatase